VKKNETSSDKQSVRKTPETNSGVLRVPTGDRRGFRLRQCEHNTFHGRPDRKPVGTYAED